MQVRPTSLGGDSAGQSWGRGPLQGVSSCISTLYPHFCLLWMKSISRHVFTGKICTSKVVMMVAVCYRNVGNTFPNCLVLTNLRDVWIPNHSGLFKIQYTCNSICTHVNQYHVKSSWGNIRTCQDSPSKGETCSRRSSAYRCWLHQDQFSWANRTCSETSWLLVHICM